MLKASKFLFLSIVALCIFTSTLAFGWGVYFNTPPHDGTLKSSFINLISRAKYSINLAIYNLNDEDVINLLAEKEMEGVKVRIVMEGENYADNIQHLKALNVVADPVEGGLMHEKIAVVDDEYVWLGSANLTHSSFYDDLNNALILKSHSMAKVLNEEFNLMYEKGFFSNSKSNLATSLSVEGIKTKIAFSPNGGVFKEIIEEIKTAKRNIYVAMYAFSDPRIALTLMLMEEKGVKIHVLADSLWNKSRYSIVEDMKEFDFNLYDNPYGLLHDKYMIIDPTLRDARVITGSYNFTRSAQTKNDEILVVFHSQKMAQIYLENFESLCTPLSKSFK